ncbi:GTP-binding protein A, partial [Favolaschia claudopus]
VMGPTGAGKTTFINLASGANLLVGMDLESCTSTVKVAPQFWLDGRLVTLIDTPGFDDTNRSDADILNEISVFLATSYKHGMTLAGIIYMHRISDGRMGGIARRHFRMFRKLCGGDTLKNVVIVTSMWGQVDRKIGEAREEQLATDDRFFKPALDQGARLVRHDQTTESAHAILHSLLGNRPQALQIQRELVDEKKDISQTAAGEELNREIAKQVKRHAEELTKLGQEMKDAIREKDEQWKAELRFETSRYQAEISELQDQSKQLVSDYAQWQAAMERKIAEQARREKLNAEAVEKDYQDLVKEVEARFRRAAEAGKQEMDANVTRLQREWQEERDALRRQILNPSVSDRGPFGTLAGMVDLLAAVHRLKQLVEE